MAPSESESRPPPWKQQNVLDALRQLLAGTMRNHEEPLDHCSEGRREARLIAGTSAGMGLAALPPSPLPLPPAEPLAAEPLKLAGNVQR